MVIHLVGLILIHIITIILFVKNVVKSLTSIILNLDEVEHLAQHVTDFDVTHHRMEIYGVCKECKEKEK